MFASAGLLPATAKDSVIGSIEDRTVGALSSLGVVDHARPGCELPSEHPSPIFLTTRWVHSPPEVV